MASSLQPSGGSPKKTYTIIKRTLPLIEVDCSTWGQMLEVAFPAPSGDAERESHIDAIVTAIDVLDAVNGRRSGFRFIDQRLAGTTVILTLAPIESHHAKARIEHVINKLKSAVGIQTPITYVKPRERPSSPSV